VFFKQLMRAVVVSSLDPIGDADPFAGEAFLEPFSRSPSLPAPTKKSSPVAINTRLKVVDSMAA